MANVLTKIQPRSEPPRPSSKHDLESAVEKADDARDIAKDLLRRLPDYDGTEDESTARHDAPQMHAHVTVNMQQPSQPDIKLEGEIGIGPVTVRGLPKWLIAALALAAAIVTALVAARFAK